MNRRLFLAALPTPFLLAGCAVLSEPEDPITYRLAPPAPITREARPVGLQVTLGPSPAMVDTQRIALSLTAEKVDVYANALWTDRVPVLIEQAVTEALRASGGYARVSDSGTQRGDWLLRLTVPMFEARYDGAGTNAAPRIVVAVEAVLRNATRDVVATQVFRNEMRAASARLDDIVAAFNRAYAETQTALLDFVYDGIGAADSAQR